MATKRRRKNHIDLVLEFESQPAQNKESFKRVFKIRSDNFLPEIPNHCTITIGELLYVRQDFIRRKIHYNGKETFHDFKNRKYTKKDEAE